MRKEEEISNPTSCLNRARARSLVFVIQGDDAAAQAAISTWAAKRIELGKNQLGDDQIVEALECSDMMEQERNGVDLQERLPL